MHVQKSFPIISSSESQRFDCAAALNESRLHPQDNISVTIRASVDNARSQRSNRRFHLRPTQKNSGSHARGCILRDRAAGSALGSVLLATERCSQPSHSGLHTLIPSPYQTAANQVNAIQLSIARPSRARNSRKRSFVSLTRPFPFSQKGLAEAQHADPLLP